MQLDVTDERLIEQAVALVQQKFGRLDVLVNNAAVASTDPDVKTRFPLCLNTNAIRPAVLSAAFRPLLLKSSKPYSIYVSSVVGSMAMASDPSSTTYNIHYPNGEAC
jgi:NAD(P)-dependent dehydrogenase (short-subunit alcohol dehydrogenase family)